MSKTSDRLTELNDKFRFVDIDFANPGWSEVDEDHNETYHTTVTVRLSHVGATSDDPFYVFDDITLDEAIRRVWREHCKKRP